MASSLAAKFEQMSQESEGNSSTSVGSVSKGKGGSVRLKFGSQEKCVVCGKTVYFSEKVVADQQVSHAASKGVA